jgi:hypothetical protein
MGWRRVMALRPTMVDFERRRFRTTPATTRQTLEGSAGAFLTGFNLELDTAPGTAPDLSHLPAARQGFAAEGAAMAATMLDMLNPRTGRRLATLRQAYDEWFVYLIQVGTGWALAKLRRPGPVAASADEPLLRWLAYDGMGFCQAFFASEKKFARWYDHPAGACPATCDIRYQGLGRSLWFRECADPDALAARVRLLPPAHRGDTWSGIGLAASYAGGCDPAAYSRLREVAHAYQPSLAQGAAFAAEAWRRHGTPPPHAHQAVEVLTGVPLSRAAGWTWAAREGLDRPDADATGYRRWRERVQEEAAAAYR